MIKCPYCYANINKKSICPNCGYSLSDSLKECVSLKWFWIGLGVGIFSLIFFLIDRDYYPKRVKFVLLGGICHIFLICVALVAYLLAIIY